MRQIDHIKKQDDEMTIQIDMRVPRRPYAALKLREGRPGGDFDRFRGSVDVILVCFILFSCYFLGLDRPLALRSRLSSSLGEGADVPLPGVHLRERHSHGEALGAHRRHGALPPHDAAERGKGGGLELAAGHGADARPTCEAPIAVPPGPGGATT